MGSAGFAVVAIDPLSHRSYKAKSGIGFKHFIFRFSYVGYLPNMIHYADAIESWRFGYIGYLA